MTLWRLTPRNAEEFSRQNELGMGYQFAEPADYSGSEFYFVLNGTFAMEVEAIFSDNEIMHTLEADLEHLPELERELVLSSDFEAFAWLAGLNSSVPPVAARFAVMHGLEAMHGSPPFSGTTGSVMTCVRYSAFASDPRVGPSGSLTPGTYATSLADAHEVPSGLGAVGRYALPNPRPAIYRFDIMVPAGTPYLYGSVVPAFGRSGGGVEIEFPNGVPNAINFVRTVITDM